MNSFMIGYGKVQIDPTQSMPLAGYGSSHKRMSIGFTSHIYHIALAFTDPNGNTAILIAADICVFTPEIGARICKAIEKECGIPADHVIISGCHQHSTPDMNNPKAPVGYTYRDEVFIPGAVAAAKAAMANRAPATVQTTSVKTDRMNFVRHYLMEDGSYAGNNFGDLTLKKVAHASEADNVMQLVKFIRKGQTTLDGKEAQDVVLTNFQGHPIIIGSKDLTIHSDVIGVYRDELEAALDCQAIYFSGASGNLLFTSKIREENLTNYDYKAHAKALVNYALNAEGTYTDVDLTAIKVKKVVYTGECNHTEVHLLDKARAAWEEFQKTDLTTNVAEGNKWFQARGFNSRYHATAIMNQAKLPETIDMELVSFSLGDVAVIGAPYEMFCDTGMYIKDNSPFPVTLVTTVANGTYSYMPTKMAFDYHCYERNQSRFARGTAEKLGDEFVGMLKELHGQY